MKRRSINEMLQYVADHPEPSSADPLQVTVGELVCRQLFSIATSPDPRVKGSMANATKAQAMLMDRLVGKRRAGSHPAQVKLEKLEFADLTAGIIEASEEEEDDD